VSQFDLYQLYFKITPKYITLPSMAKALEIKVKESLRELKQLQKAQPKKRVRIQMLVLIKEEKQRTKNGLAEALGVSNKSVHIWRNNYLKGGITLMLEDKRGGNKAAQITPTMALRIEKRLSNPKEGFKSYVEAQRWINEHFGLKMEYQAVNKFLKRKFDTKLKVARRSHIDKDAADEAVFKKPA
jgi:transposase